jgi:translocation and assembly module TamB
MKIFFMFLFLILLILIGSITWIVSTDQGFEFLIIQAQRFAPGELKIEQFEGRLIDKISLKKLSYQLDETKAQVDSFLFDWNAEALLEGKVHIEQLHVDNINVHLPKTEEEKPEKDSGPLELPDIQLPIQIAIDDVQINHVSIQTGDAEPFMINSIALRSTTTEVLSLEHFQIHSPQFNAKLAGDVGLIAPHTVQLDLNWSAKLPDFTVVGAGELSGDIQQLMLTHTVSKPLEVDLKGTVTDVLGALNMNVALSWHEVYWPFNPEIPKDYLVHSQKGLVTLTGSLENYQLNLIANVTGQQIPKGHWTITAQGNQEAITLEKLHSKILTGVIDATGYFSWQPALAGQINLNADNITIKEFWKDWPDALRLDSRVIAELDTNNKFKVKKLDVTIPQTGAKVSVTAEGVQAGEKTRFKTAKVTWQNAQWPLLGFDNAIAISKQGQMNLSGSLQDYQLKLNTHLTGAQIPPGKVNLAGRGSLQQFTIESLTTDILKGIVKATGQVNWQPKLAAQLNLNTNNITIKDFWKDWPRNLTINSQLQAKLDDKNFKISQLDVKLPQTAAHVFLSGEGSLNEEGPYFNFVNLGWQKLQWPLVGKKALVNSKTGTVNFNGTLQGYQVEVKTQVTGEQIPPSNIKLSGHGDLEEFTFQSLQAELLKGAINAEGQVRWKPTLGAQVNLDVENITVKRFWKDWPDKLRINSHLVANLDDKYFQVQQLHVDLPQTKAQIAVQAEGALRSDGPRFENAVVSWQDVQWPLMGKEIIAKSQKGSVNLIGTLQDYQVDLATQFTGAQIPPGYLTLIGSGNLEQFNIESFHSDILQGAVSATGQVAWKPNLKGQIDMNVNEITIKDFWKDWPEQLSLNTHLVANIDDKDFQVDTLNVEIPQTGVQLALQGNGTLNGEKTRFNTNVAWENLQWPLVGEDILVNTPSGQLSAKGSAQAYQLSLDTEIHGKDIPAGRWQATGSGDTESLHLQSLQGNILQGALDLSGQVRWQPNVSWQIELAGDNINPGSQWTQWPGQIALGLSSQGKLLKNGALDTQVTIRNIVGQLRNYPLQLKTDVAVKMPPTPTTKKGKKPPKPGLGTISINHLEFQSGNNSVTANGKLGDKSKLDWTINAADLAALLPDLQGRLTGKGRISGPLDLPHVTANLKGNGLGFQENRLKMLRADVDVNLLTQKNLRLDILAKDFKQGETTQVKQATIKGQGSLKNHSLEAKVNLPKDRLSVNLRGNFKQAQSLWQGQLQNLEASTEKFGYWQLQKPTALTLSAEKAQLDRACLDESKSGTVCTKLNWQKTADTEVQLTLDELPLMIAQAFLPKDMDIAGTLNGRVATTLRPDGKISSDVTFNLSPGMVKMIVADEKQALKFQGGDLKVQIAQNGLAANLQLGLLDQSGLQSTFTMPRLTHVPPAGEQPMRGKIQAKFADFGLLPLFAPQIENPKGLVNMDLAVGGSLAQPLLQGQIRVNDVEVDLPDLGLELRKLNVTVLAKGQDIQMQAGVNSGDGVLNLKGQAQLVSPTDWKADLKLTGKDFQVVDISEAWVLATPNIAIKVVPDKLDVVGEVIIPEAALTLPQAASGSVVTVSKDVVIVNPTDPQPEEEKPVSSPMAINSQVKVILGDNVTFDGAGFRSSFGGSVTATTTLLPGKEPSNIGNGQINVFNGSYKAYGQNLRIDQGKVFFSGGPIENPGLDIPAYRLIKRSGEDDVTAGIYIQGTAQNPKMELFSNPPFDQSNTLSYIILGKPAAEASGSEGDLLVSAAMSLPLGKANTIAGKIGKDLGLDEAGVTTDEELGGAALMVGKYLTPGLYISYGVGLFDGSTLLRMRYDLTKNVTLETETGTQSGVDLRYTIDW